MDKYQHLVAPLVILDGSRAAGRRSVKPETTSCLLMCTSRAIVSSPSTPTTYKSKQGSETFHRCPHKHYYTLKSLHHRLFVQLRHTCPLRGTSNGVRCHTHESAKAGGRRQIDCTVGRALASIDHKQAATLRYKTSDLTDQGRQVLT